MNWLRFFRRAKKDAESAADLQFYLDTETEDNIARGMHPEQARLAARKKLGNPTSIREEIWRRSSIGFFETVWQDLRYALRTMRKSPAFTLTAVLILAVGIGGNTTMFTVINGVLLKPLGYREPGQLVRVFLSNPKQPQYDASFSLLRLEEIKASAKSFSGIGAFLKFKQRMALAGRGEPEALQGARVWKRNFASDPQIAGKTATLNSTAYTIIGVLPDSFVFPFTGTDVWVTRPAEWSAVSSRFWPYVNSLNGIARLKPGTSLRQAQSELNVLNRQYALAHPESNPERAGAAIRVTPLKDHLVSSIRPTLLMLFGAVAFVLLIACANVASLLLARANVRSREFAVRAAVGASRGRLVRQLLAESVVLATIGGVLGILLTRWALSAIKHLTALNLPRMEDIRLDWTVLGFTLAASLTTGILFALFPALWMSHPNLATELRASGAGAGRRLSARRRAFDVNIRGLLAAGQIALSIVLMIGATLLMKSFVRLRSVDPGLQSSNLLTMKISLPLTRYETDARKIAFFRDLVQRVELLPGVDSATVAMSLPTTADWIGTNVLAEGQPAVDGAKQITARLQSITPGYVRTMGIPLRRGRAFTPRDENPGALPVVLINESFARRFWPGYPAGRNPVGQHLREGIDHTSWMEIIGVVGNVHEGDLTGDSGPEFYVPVVVHPPQTAYLAVRTTGDPMSYADAVRKQVLAIDGSQPVSEVRTMEEVLDATTGQRWQAIFPRAVQPESIR